MSLRNPIDFFKARWARREATTRLIQALEGMHCKGCDAPGVFVPDIKQALEDGADGQARGVHARARVRMCAVGLAAGHVGATGVLLDHGARYDHTFGALLRHLVSSQPDDLPIFSRAARMLDGEAIASVAMILQAGPCQGFDRKAFFAQMHEVVVDRTRGGAAQRKLGVIWEDKLPGFAALCEHVVLDQLAQAVAEPAVDTAPKARTRRL